MSDDLFDRANEFLAMFRRGADFTKELVQENARLRRRLLEVETRQDDAARDPGQWAKLRQELLDRIRGLEGERSDALERMRQLEEENRQFASRFVEVEEENNHLANLYVASYQLHSTLNVAEVVKIIIEIVINLVGAHTFAVYVYDEKTGLLEAVAAEGEDVAVFPSMTLGEGVVGSAVAAGATQCSDEPASEDFAHPIVAIPLRVNERAIGAIAIFELLEQKHGLTTLDHELFTLLAGHAATAIFAAQLHNQSERKLSTIQGFIDLLTK
jgi:nitrate/nitrite-specific signal transduction histidine kinase